jgi:hypothetical protein
MHISKLFTACSYETDYDVQYKRPQLVSFLRPSILRSILVQSTERAFYEYVTLLYTKPSTSVEKKIIGRKKTVVIVFCCPVYHSLFYTNKKQSALKCIKS